MFVLLCKAYVIVQETVTTAAKLSLKMKQQGSQDQILAKTGVIYVLIPRYATIKQFIMKKILIHISPGFQIIKIKQLTEYCTRKSQFEKLLNISQVSVVIIIPTTLTIITKAITIRTTIVMIIMIIRVIMIMIIKVMIVTLIIIEQQQQ